MDAAPRLNSRSHGDDERDDEDYYDVNADNRPLHNRYLQVSNEDSIFPALLTAPFRAEGYNFMRRPKGIKTKKSVAKRFKITARGKVMRMRAGKRHLLQGKNAKRRRISAPAKKCIRPIPIGSPKACRSAINF